VACGTPVSFSRLDLGVVAVVAEDVDGGGIARTGRRFVSTGSAATSTTVEPRTMVARVHRPFEGCRLLSRRQKGSSWCAQWCAIARTWRFLLTGRLDAFALGPRRRRRSSDSGRRS
jgi:hypothetical protein